MKRKKNENKTKPKKIKSKYINYANCRKEKQVNYG